MPYFISTLQQRTEYVVRMALSVLLLKNNFNRSCFICNCLSTQEIKDTLGVLALTLHYMSAQLPQSYCGWQELESTNWSGLCHEVHKKLSENQVCVKASKETNLHVHAHACRHLHDHNIVRSVENKMLWFSTVLWTQS